MLLSFPSRRISTKVNLFIHYTGLQNLFSLVWKQKWSSPKYKNKRHRQAGRHTCRPRTTKKIHILVYDIWSICIWFERNNFAVVKDATVLYAHCQPLPISTYLLNRELYFIFAEHRRIGSACRNACVIYEKSIRRRKHKINEFSFCA